MGAGMSALCRYKLDRRKGLTRSRAYKERCDECIMYVLGAETALVALIGLWSLYK